MSNTTLISKEERRVLAEQWEEMVSMHRDVVTIHELRSLMMMCNVQPMDPIEEYEQLLPGNGISLTFSGFLAIMESEKKNFLKQSSTDTDLHDAYTAVGGSSTEGHIDNQNVLNEICNSFGLQLDLGNSVRPDRYTSINGEVDTTGNDSWRSNSEQGLSFDDFTAILSSGSVEENDVSNNKHNINLDCSIVRKYCEGVGWQTSTINELIEDLDADQSGIIDRDEVLTGIQRRLRKLQALKGGKLKIKPSPSPNATDQELLEHLVVLCTRIRTVEFEQERTKKRFALDEASVSLAGYKSQYKKSKSRLRLTSITSKVLSNQTALWNSGKYSSTDNNEESIFSPSPPEQKNILPTDAFSMSCTVESAMSTPCGGYGKCKKRNFRKLNLGKNPPRQKRFKKILNFHPVAAEYKRNCFKEHTKYQSQIRLGIQSTDQRCRGSPGNWEHCVDKSDIPMYSLPIPTQLSLPTSTVPFTNTNYLGDDNANTTIDIEPSIIHPGPVVDPVVGRKSKVGSRPVQFVACSAEREKMNKKIAKFSSNGKPRPPIERKLFDHYFGFVLPPRYAAQEMVKGQNDEFHGLMEFVPRSGPVMSSKSKNQIDELHRLSLDSDDVVVPTKATRRPTLSTNKSFDTSSILRKLGLRSVDYDRKGA